MNKLTESLNHTLSVLSSVLSIYLKTIPCYCELQVHWSQKNFLDILINRTLAGNDIPRGDVHQSILSHHIQVRRLLSWRSGAAGLHQVPEQTRHRHLDLGRTWRVSICICLFSFIISECLP
jgi:hypothetical protein